jgi:hypothetical protein
MLLSVVIASLLFTAAAYAHHSFAATYNEEQVQQIEGKMVAFMFRNPHSSIQVETADGKGGVVRWVVEWAAGNTLNREGVTRDTLRPGDHIIVTGSPGRVPEDRRLRLRSVERPSDGWKWSGEFQ